MYLGLDPTMAERKATAWAVVDGQGRLIDAGKRYGDADLLALAGEFGASTVGIDAPLGYPRGMCCLEASCACAPVGDTLRACERALVAEGISLYPTTKRSFIKPMVYRAIGLAWELRMQGRCVLEVYPYAAKVRLWGRPIPKKTTPEGLRWLREKVAELVGEDSPDPHPYGPLRAVGPAPHAGEGLLAGHDACDAALAGYTAALYAQGRVEALGWPDEAQIAVPRARA
ncbi:MAG: DUF429 domain-containing protein [SAR202 cluster bacterium]|nr:DUF429 domain-containing protein [SAR202 cluster bacterium]